MTHETPRRSVYPGILPVGTRAGATSPALSGDRFCPRSQGHDGERNSPGFRAGSFSIPIPMSGIARPSVNGFAAVQGNAAAKKAAPCGSPVRTAPAVDVVSAAGAIGGASCIG